MASTFQMQVNMVIVGNKNNLPIKIGISKTSDSISKIFEEAKLALTFDRSWTGI